MTSPTVSVSELKSIAPVVPELPALVAAPELPTDFVLPTMIRRYPEPVTVTIDEVNVAWHGPVAQVSDKSNMFKSQGGDKRRTRDLGIFGPVAWLRVDECQHGQTMCDQCIREWGWDYVVRRSFRKHGLSGYTEGCRCLTCRAVKSSRSKKRRAS